MRPFPIAILFVLAATPRVGPAQQAADTVSLTIHEAVARALRFGDETRTAAALVDVADAQVSIARAAGFPQLRLSGSQSHVIQSARAQAVGQIFNQPNTYTANANLSQALFQGGRIFAGTRAASNFRGAARMDAAETRAQASLEVQRAYLQVLLSKRVADIQDTGLDLARQRLKQTEQFQAAGRAARYDVLRARVEQANLEPLAIQARSDVELSALELKRLINISPGQTLRLTSTIDTAAVLRLVERVRSAPTAESGRPVLRSAELVARARRDAIRVARADLFPSITVNGLVGAQAFPQSGFPTTRGAFETVACPPGSAADRVCTRQNGGWFGDKSFGVGVSWPLFDGFRAKSAIDLASAQSRVADLQLSQARERVATELARSRSDLDRARSLFAARRQNAGEADEAFRLAELRYSRGLGTQLEISDAQLALTTARTNEARAIFDLYLAAAALARASGHAVPFPDSESTARPVLTGVQ